MRRKERGKVIRSAVALGFLAWGTLQGQQAQMETGTLRGVVRLAAQDAVVPHATILITKLGRSSLSREDGSYEFTGLPAGEYEVLVHYHPLADERKTVVIPAGGVVTQDFYLKLAPLHQEIVVTATGKQEAAYEVIQSTSTLERVDLLPKAVASLGDLLEFQPGVAKRSFGPGTTRPIIRGFDGDRVLILQDGMPAGTLSSQSGDHAEPVSLSGLERVEIVRGPSTLLYSSNALGGVVNVITEHHQEHEHAHEGARGYLTGAAGTGNALAGAGGGFEVGSGRWLVTSNGGADRAGDYHSPSGVVENSLANSKNASVTLGRYGDRGFLKGGWAEHWGLYGIPSIHIHEAEHEGSAHHSPDSEEYDHQHPLKLRWKKQGGFLAGSLNHPHPYLERLTMRLAYTGWNHKELLGEQTGTEFQNRQWTLRAVAAQQSRGVLSGTFGFQALKRSYRVRGEEQVTPPVEQAGWALFGLETLGFDRIKLQFGLRAEANRYRPLYRPARSFTGLSGSAGLNVSLWKNWAVVASATRSSRAPSVEELYNYGPHYGNLAYEIGDANLRGERTRGVELGLRHYSRRVHLLTSLFYYHIGDYVFLEPSPAIRHGLRVARYKQSLSRYAGGEAELHIAFREDVWLKLGADGVDARLIPTDMPLPRIPPVRGWASVEGRYKGINFKPEVILSFGQNRVYPGENKTGGFVLANLGAFYNHLGKRALHTLSVHIFNATNRLYRNHVSLIKDFVPELGRAIRVTYNVRFF